MKLSTAPATPDPKSLAAELDRLGSLAFAAGKDFNDELTVILSLAGLSLDRLGPAHPAVAGLVELQQAAARCAETARCLLLFTQRSRDAIRYPGGRTGHAHPGH